jgi:surface protein
MISLLALVAVATETKAADVSLTPDGSGGYYVKLVKNTTSTLTLDGTVSTFKVYDDGGASGYMTSGSHNDYLVINVPTGYKLRVDGYMRAKSTVTLYDGNSTSAPVLAGPLSPSSGYYCKIYATSTGNSIMVRLYDIYASSDYDGLDLTVTLLLDEKRTPLTLEAVDDETTINILNPNGLTIEYNKNGGEWVPSDANPISISVNANDKVQLRGNNSCYWGTGDSGETPTRITATGRCYIYGNVMSLVHASDFATNSTLTEEFALAYLFAAPSDDPLQFYDNNTTMLSHGTNELALPAASVPGSGYMYMFAGCQALTRAPQLPATTLGDGCYHQMFTDCSGLTSAPELPATTLAPVCYSNMFTNCTSLETAPALPAAILAEGCYFGMFEGCTGLKETPLLTAETLVADCYSLMFHGCSSLNKVTCFATDISATGCTSDWLDGVAATGTFTKPAATDTWTTGASGIPEGWTTDDKTLSSYAILCDNGTLYFRCSYFDYTAYDTFKPEDGSASSTISNVWGDAQVVGNRYGDVSPSWCGRDTYNKIKAVVFEPSFQAARPVNLYGYFYGCRSLTTITGWENLNTSENRQTMWMFQGCSQLKAVDVTHFRMGKTTRTHGMFNGCVNLTTINGIEDLDMSHVEGMGYMFYKCQQLTSLDLSRWDISNATGMQDMFRECTALTSLDIHTWNTPKVQSMYEMFYGCKNLETLDVSKFETGNVINMESMFSGCSKLGTIDVSGFDTRNVTRMVSMFYNCSAVTTLDVSGFSTEKVQNFASMFNGCTNVGALDVSHFSTAAASSVAFMFKNCSQVTTLDLGKFYTSNISSMEGMFNGCTALQSVYVNNLWSTANVTVSTNMFAGCTAIVGEDGTTVADGSPVDKTNAHYGAGGYLRHTTDVDLGTQPYVIWDANTHKLYMLQSDATLTANDAPGDLPDGTTVTGIWYGDNAIMPQAEWESPIWNGAAANGTYVRQDIEHVVILPSFATVQPTDMTSWFENFSNMTDIDGIEYLDTSHATNMYGMFNLCEKLTTLDLTAWDVSKVQNMGYLFNGCLALTDIDLTGWDTRNVEYFYDTFNYCPELTTIKGIENFNTEKALSFSQMLASCNALTSLDLSGWKTTAATGFSYMFSYDENLEAIYVGEGWTTAAAEYSNSMFYGCTSIVGQDGTEFDSNCIDATKAHYGTGGYLRKKQFLLGDVNGDGKVTPADAIMILYHYFGVVQTDFIEAAANVNGDENISPADAIGALYIYFGATAGARSSSPAKDTTIAPRDPE